MDVGQIQQVVLNLVMNAHQAMGEARDPVRLAVRSTDDVGVDGERVELAVHDRGRGIAQEVLERIFEPFFTTKGPTQGTGLGLTVVHGIVQAHGGFVRVRSDAEQGTELAVRLPHAS